jgi:pyruvate dehydrogenase E2 component (dihydrolipoamide acetyltransferase)
MEFKLPELGEGVHEGELVRWKVKPGDTVKDDQPLCEIMTDKATVEIPSPFHGKVQSLHLKEGEIAKVGQVMISFEGAAKSGGASASTSAPSAHAAPAAAATPMPKPAAVAPVGGAVAAGPAMPSTDIATRVLAAPSTRKFARESGVDLGRVNGTGPHGRVMREDVERAISGGGKTTTQARPALQPGQLEERVPFRGLRKKISEKMRQSKDHAAHFTYVEEADVTQLVKLRDQAKEIGARQGVKVTYLPFIMKTMVAALKHYPILNSSLDEEKGELIYKHYYNIGLSVQTEEGLTAPVIKDVGNKSILQIAKDIQEVVERARAKRLTLDDLQGGTITVTNAGTIGGLFATPVINYPEVAILGFNKIFRKPVAKTIKGREKVVIRDWTYFSISLDHRVVDGAIGAEFMKLFIQYIENPSLLLLESL